MGDQNRRDMLTQLVLEVVAQPRLLIWMRADVSLIRKIWLRAISSSKSLYNASNS